MSLIKIEKIRKTFGKGKAATPVLRGINLSIKEGEFVAIMGASGSGKTTLMNIIGMLDRPKTGAYHFNGQNVNRLSDKELAELRRNTIGFVFQSFNLLGRLTNRANVELPMMYNHTSRSERKRRSTELLKLVNLGDRINYKPTELSGGQMQRVAVARALANRPSVILADEPTGNLDSKTGEDVLKLLTKLHAEGNTIIVITHDSYVAKQAQRIIHIKDGKIARKA